MKVLITGAAGMIGRKLAARLAGDAALNDTPIDHMLLVDVVPPEARGTVAGVMNLVGWLGGGSAPLVIGHLAMAYGLSMAISYAAVVYIAAGILLLAACWFLTRTPDPSSARVS